jgi:hypothetical protein
MKTDTTDDLALRRALKTTIAALDAATTRLAEAEKADATATASVIAAEDAYAKGQPYDACEEADRGAKRAGRDLKLAIAAVSAATIARDAAQDACDKREASVLFSETREGAFHGRARPLIDRLRSLDAVAAGIVAELQEEADRHAGKLARLAVLQGRKAPDAYDAFDGERLSLLVRALVTRDREETGRPAIPPIGMPGRSDIERQTGKPVRVGALPEHFLSAQDPSRPEPRADVAKDAAREADRYLAAVAVTGAQVAS